jgi:hypothetical protein
MYFDRLTHAPFPIPLTRSYIVCIKSTEKPRLVEMLEEAFSEERRPL